GSAEGLSELMEVVAFGFPFGTALSADRRDYPAVSVNVGSVTALRRKAGALHRIQVDVPLNPGNSGGAVLDRTGKVVGVVVAGAQPAVGAEARGPVRRRQDGRGGGRPGRAGGAAGQGGREAEAGLGRGRHLRASGLARGRGLHGGGPTGGQGGGAGERHADLP